MDIEKTPSIVDGRKEPNENWTLGQLANFIMKKPYARVLTSENGVVYTATISEFPGCISEGKSAAEAALKIESVAVDWLIGCIVGGLQIPKPSADMMWTAKQLSTHGQSDKR